MWMAEKKRRGPVGSGFSSQLTCVGLARMGGGASFPLLPVLCVQWWTRPWSIVPVGKKISGRRSQSESALDPVGRQSRA